MPQPVGWGAAPTRRARPATWRPRTLSGLSTAWGSIPEWTSARWCRPVSGWPGTWAGRRRRGPSRRSRAAMAEDTPSDPTVNGPTVNEPTPNDPTPTGASSPKGLKAWLLRRTEAALRKPGRASAEPVSYTHLRAHETD